MQVELRTIQREVGITFVFVTHDQGEALSMSSRVAVFNLGCLEQVGTPREIYNHPATSFVASFVGTSNLIDEASSQRLFGEPGRAHGPTGADPVRPVDSDAVGPAMSSPPGRSPTCSIWAPIHGSTSPLDHGATLAVTVPSGSADDIAAAPRSPSPGRARRRSPCWPDPPTNSRSCRRSRRSR